MPDDFETYRPGLSSPAEKHFPIVADPGIISPRPRSIFCASDGTITVSDIDDVSIVYTLVAGQVMTFRATKVTAITGTFVGWI